MKSKALAIVATAVFLNFAGTAAWAKPAGARIIEGEMVVQVMGSVKSLDANAGRVTIVDARGREMQLSTGIPPQALAALPIGSLVTDLTLQAVALSSARGAAVQEAIPGDRQFVAQVTSADAKTGVVMLKDANDLPVEVHVRDAREAGALTSGMNVKVDAQDRL